MEAQPPSGYVRSVSVATSEEIDRRPLEVPHRVFELAHSIPPLPHLDEGILEQLLRFVRASGDQDEDPEQARALRFEERLEVL